MRGGVAVAAVVALALLLGLRLTPDRQGLVVLSGQRVPELCLSKARTGQPCPGCGFGRSVIEAAKGRIESSRALHPAGVFLAAWLWSVALLSVVLVLARRAGPGAVVEAGVYLAGLVVACLFAAAASLAR